MTWDEIYDRAEDKACGSIELKAKDTARWEVCQLALEFGMPDLEREEIPEDAVDSVCTALDIEFNEDGNITYIHFPAWIEEMITRRKEDDDLKQDILNRISERKEYEQELNRDFSDKELWDMMRAYRHIFDCNIDYNTTIDSAIDKFLGKF